ncbi:MAG: CXXX repeat peptide modification system protein [Desulfomonilaceae bacterium]
MKIQAVGKVTESERDEIKILFERKNGLMELFKSIQDPSHPLYDRIVQDMGTTATRFQKWWDEKRGRYKWKGREGHHWEIDFETCEIFLKKDR